jgi:hypothetical protein
MDSFRGLPRAEDRVDEHRSVEAHAPAAQAVVAAIAVLSAGSSVPGVAFLSSLVTLMTRRPAVAGAMATFRQQCVAMLIIAWPDHVVAD